MVLHADRALFALVLITACAPSEPAAPVRAVPERRAGPAHVASKAPGAVSPSDAGAAVERSSQAAPRSQADAAPDPVSSAVPAQRAADPVPWPDPTEAPRATSGYCRYADPNKREMGRRADLVFKAVVARRHGEKVYSHCGQFKIIGPVSADPRSHQPDHLLVRVVPRGERELLMPTDRNGSMHRSDPFSFDELSCMGFKLEKACGDRARFRQTEGGCRPALDVRFESRRSVRIEHAHISGWQPPFECEESDAESAGRPNEADR